MKFTDETLNNIRDYINDGYISCRKHPRYDIWIYNYTVKATYERKWDDLIRKCRGLVLDAQGNVIARGFTKFFNDTEPECVYPKNDDNYTVYEKLDGSMVIIFRYNNELIFSTRGSFESDQAIKAKEIFERDYSEFSNSLLSNRTYVCEVIYPENRIVVDYGNIEDIYLLAILDPNDFNQEYSKEYNKHTLFPKPKTRGYLNFKTLKELNTENEEGFVVRFDYPPYTRVKLKFETYFKISNILKNISPLSIWKYLSGIGEKESPIYEKDFESTLSEYGYYDEYKRIVNELKFHYAYILSIHKQALNFILFYFIDSKNDRKLLAETILKISKQYYLNKSILFSLYDGKDTSKIIWKMIRPRGDE